MRLGRWTLWWAVVVTTGLHVHDGPSWPLSSYTLQILLLLSSLPLTNTYDGPFQARRSVEGLYSVTLKLHGIWVLGLLFDHHDDQQDRPSSLWRSVMNFVIPHLGQTSPIVLHQLHHDANYGPSQAQRTVTGPVDGNFYVFLAQKLLHSSLNKFPANKEKIT